MANRHFLRLPALQLNLHDSEFYFLQGYCQVDCLAELYNHLRQPRHHLSEIKIFCNQQVLKIIQNNITVV
jgi:hypothetical protein